MLLWVRSQSRLRISKNKEDASALGARITIYIHFLDFYEVKFAKVRVL